MVAGVVATSGGGGSGSGARVVSAPFEQARAVTAQTVELHRAKRRMPGEWQKRPKGQKSRRKGPLDDENPTSGLPKRGLRGL
jgi:hypothetical protein